MQKTFTHSLFCHWSEKQFLTLWQDNMVGLAKGLSEPFSWFWVLCLTSCWSSAVCVYLVLNSGESSGDVCVCVCCVCAYVCECKCFHPVMDWCRFQGSTLPLCHPACVQVASTHSAQSKYLHSLWSKYIHSLWSKYLHSLWSKYVHSAWSKYVHSALSKYLHSAWSKYLLMTHGWINLLEIVKKIRSLWNGIFPQLVLLAEPH